MPLAIAQAGAYLQESGVGLAAYLKFYEKQWSELMGSGDWVSAPLQDYPDRSVWTTWAISYQKIRDKHEATANLLLLWSFLDNKDLWHGLFAAGCEKSTVTEMMLSEWIGDIATNELEFSQAMQLLRSYSLIEEVDATSYSTHPVVHRWAYHYQGKHLEVKLGKLAVVTVGAAVPEQSARDSAPRQRRLLSHAHACSRWVYVAQLGQSDQDCNEGEEQHELSSAIHGLGDLYADQGRLAEAEQMYKRALQGTEEALGPKHTSTLGTVNNLGSLYKNQGRLAEAEQMYKSALQGYMEALGVERVQQYIPALNTIENLGNLYEAQGNYTEAHAMYAKALSGSQGLLGQSSDRCKRLVAKMHALPTSEPRREKQPSHYTNKRLPKSITRRVGS